MVLERTKYQNILEKSL